MDGPQGQWARGLTLLLTNITKFGGLIIALHELLLRATLRPVAVAEAAFMMAGAQISERMILAMIDRLLGHPPESETREP